MGYSLQKSYADNRIRDLEFEIGDHVYLKISPMKRVIKFGQKGKLCFRYIFPYYVFQQVGKVTYELKLPMELVSIGPVFYVSMLKKCIGNPTYILRIKGLGVHKNLSYD